jgi:hypothetical protein
VEEDVRFRRDPAPRDTNELSGVEEYLRFRRHPA